MITYTGFRKTKVILSGGAIVINGGNQAIENLKEIEDFKSRMKLGVVLSLQTIVLMLIVAFVVHYLNYNRSDQILILILSIAMLSACVFLLRYATKYRSAWIYNDRKTLLIEKADPLDTETALLTLATTISNRPGLKSVQCPYRHERTLHIPPCEYSCHQCGSTFTVKADYSIAEVKQPRLYTFLEIMSFLALILMAFIPGHLSNFIIVTPIIMLFSTMVVEGLNHGILIGSHGTIYRSETPRLFNVALLCCAGLVFFILWCVLTMHK
jgi:hypothetical protein